MNVVLDNSDIRLIKYKLKEYNGVRNYLERVLKDLDATLVLPDGSRPRQTNSYVWAYSNAEFYYLINNSNLTQEEINSYMSRYNDVIDNNKKYELENPPIVYSKKKITKRKTRVDKVKSMFNNDILNVGETTVKEKPKKETVAERKAKLFSNKAVTFAFSNIKTDK